MWQCRLVWHCPFATTNVHGVYSQTFCSLGVMPYFVLRLKTQTRSPLSIILYSRKCSQEKNFAKSSPVVRHELSPDLFSHTSTNGAKLNPRSVLTICTLALSALKGTTTALEKQTAKNTWRKSCFCGIHVCNDIWEYAVKGPGSLLYSALHNQLG